MSLSETVVAFSSCTFGSVAGVVIQGLFVKDKSPRVNINVSAHDNDTYVSWQENHLHEDRRVTVLVPDRRSYPDLRRTPPRSQPPRDSGRSASTAPTGSGSAAGPLIAIVVAAVLLATFYSRHHVGIVHGVLFIACFAGAAFVTSMITLAVKGIRLHQAVVTQILALIVLLAGTFLSIIFLNNPPLTAFNSSETYAHLLATFNTQGAGAVEGLGFLGGTEFLVYQFIGAGFTALLALVTAFATIKVVAAADIAYGGPTPWRLGLATRVMTPFAALVVGFLVAAMALLFSSGLAFKGVQAWTSKPLFPVTTTTESSTVTSPTHAPTTTPKAAVPAHPSHLTTTTAHRPVTTAHAKATAPTTHPVTTTHPKAAVTTTAKKP